MTPCSACSATVMLCCQGAPVSSASTPSVEFVKNVVDEVAQPPGNFQPMSITSLFCDCCIDVMASSDVNKATCHKAKARELKAKDFQDSPRPGQDQTFPRPRPRPHCYRTKPN